VPDPLDGLILSVDTLAALRLAATRRVGHSLGTFDILLGLVAVDDTGDWSWVQVHTQPIVADHGHRYVDSETSSVHHWDTVPLTGDAASGLITAARIARTYGFVPLPPGVLALGILSSADFGAARALLGPEAVTQYELLDLVQDSLLGTRLESLGSVIQPPEAKTDDPSPNLSQAAPDGPAPPSRTKDARPSAAAPAGPRRPVDRRQEARNRLGFRTGTFLGAGVLSLVGGLPLATAVALATAVQYGATRARKRRIPPRIIQVASIAGLVAAVLLATTAHTNIQNDRDAVHLLNAAKSDIARDDLVAATKSLGGAGLYEPQSTTILLLSACVDWDLGFKDYASFEAQYALFLGHGPDQPSGFRGTDCFLDTAQFHGMSFVKVDGFGWVIYTEPWNTDSAGKAYLSIAQSSESQQPAQELVALACLDNRYDFRSLAAIMLTFGLNENELFGGHPFPSSAIRYCLGQSAMTKAYHYFPEPGTHYDLYVPADYTARIPSPTKPHPPVGVCWSKYPAGGPCNANG
jgi:hypothetical protein